MRRQVINIVFVLIVYKFKAIAAIGDETCQLNRDMENQCRTYSYTVVKPMLDYVRQVEEELQQSKEKDRIIADIRKKNDDLVNDLRSQIQVQKVIDYGKCKDELAEISMQLVSKEGQLFKKEEDIDFHKKRFDNLYKSFEDYKKRQHKCQSKNLKNCEDQLKKLNSSLIEKVENTSDLQSQIDLHKQTIDKLRTKSEDCDKYREETRHKSKNLEICEVQLKELSEISSRYNPEIENSKENEANFQGNERQLTLCERQVRKLNSIIAKNETPSDCVPFGRNSGVYPIKVYKDNIFDVKCDSEPLGPGWLVIQQRLDGSEDFNRNWISYREGFGSYEADFFLGLEKIHALTKYRPQELNVQFVLKNGTIGYAQYSSFKIADEANNYTLSLGKFNGDMDILGMCNNQTYDRDTDQNCAREKGTGWWFPFYDSSNSNGLYLRSDKDEIVHLQNTTMLIRPTYTFFKTRKEL